MRKNKLIILLLFISIGAVSAVFFNAKMKKGRDSFFKRVSEKDINFSIGELLRWEKGTISNEEKGPRALKFLKKNVSQVRSVLLKRLNRRKSLGYEVLDTLSVIDRVGMDEALRREVFQIISNTKESKKKGHHSSLSTQDHIRLKGLELLYKETKSGRKDSKRMLVDLLLKRDFPNKYKISNFLLKANGSKRRALQVELKKVLPKEEHYLLFRK
tara:strand:- start:492 stop:1133 length:642 start_codon:yes stop_codon:yes gene_type:complete